MFFNMDGSSSKSKKNVGSKKILNSGKKLSVLIVDDDPVIRKIHKVLLTKFGLETQAVANGKEAVDLHRSGVSFDLVLMDMEMPIMNGPEATRELRAMGVSTMIVGVTSRGLDSEKQDFMGAGLNACHEKPLTKDAVSSFLQGLLANQ